MGNEMSKASIRRAKDWRYANRWFVGNGLDVGCGFDLMKVTDKITAITGYDLVLGNKNAQTLPEYSEELFDFVVSSHCLEHMREPEIALYNWLRVCKSGGYVIFTVPDWKLYEHKHWPSRYNGDHRASFTLEAETDKDGKPHPSNVIHLPSWIRKFTFNCDVEMIQLLTEHFDYDAADSIDQTGGLAECAIECILRKQ